MKIQTGALLLVVGFLFGCTDATAKKDSRSQADQQFISQEIDPTNKNVGDFEGEVGNNQTEQNTASDIISQAFPPASFPRETCGDPLPSDKSDYPINYYAVFVPDVGDNLEVIRSEFCVDAFSKKDATTGEDVIQVASFHTEKAHEFVSLMEVNFGEGTKLGKPSVVNYPN